MSDSTPISPGEERLRFLDAPAELTKAADTPAEVMTLTARMLGQQLGANRCAYAHVDADQDHFEVLGDYTDGVASILGPYAFSALRPVVRQLIPPTHPSFP